MTELQQDYEMEEKAIEVVSLGTIRAAGPQDVIVRATAIAKTLANIIRDRKLYTPISGKNYVRVEGWTTMGAMLGVLPREVSVTMLDNEDYEATVELIRATDGAVVGGASAIVSSDESTWKSRPRYARRSMAITRATGKAYRLGFSWIMALAGYEPTPAEEMADVIDGHFQEQPPRRRQPARTKAQPKPEPEPEPEPEPATNHDFSKRPYTPDTLKAALAKKADGIGNYSPSDKQRNLLGALLSEFYAGDDTARYTASTWLFGASSTKEIDGAMVKAALDWLKPDKDDGGAYVIDAMSRKELSSVLAAAQADDGQEALL